MGSRSSTGGIAVIGPRAMLHRPRFFVLTQGDEHGKWPLYRVRARCCEEDELAKPEWGQKRTCQSCGCRFYDLTRTPIICPKCGATVEPDMPFKVRRGSSSAAAAAEKAEKAAAAAAAVPVDLEVDDLPAADEDDEALESGDEGAEDDESGLIEDASDLGEDDDDMAEVMEHMDEEIEDEV